VLSVDVAVPAPPAVARAELLSVAVAVATLSAPVADAVAEASVVAVVVAVPPLAAVEVAVLWLVAVDVAVLLVQQGRCNAGDQSAYEQMGREETAVPSPANPPSNPALNVSPGGIQMR